MNTLEIKITVERCAPQAEVDFLLSRSGNDDFVSIKTESNTYIVNIDDLSAALKAFENMRLKHAELKIARTIVY